MTKKFLVDRRFCCNTLTLCHIKAPGLLSLNIISWVEMTKPLLIMDLDETLIFGTREPLTTTRFFRCGDFYIYKRPGVLEFIRKCATVYKLAVWTSSSSDYAECIADALLSDATVEFVWARNRCVRRLNFETQEYYWVKDLKKVKRMGFDLGRVLAVDDTAAKLERNYGNLVQVNEFTGDECDTELLDLATYLVELSSAADFRLVEKRRWRTEMR